MQGDSLQQKIIESWTAQIQWLATMAETELNVDKGMHVFVENACRSIAALERVAGEAGIRELIKELELRINLTSENRPKKRAAFDLAIQVAKTYMVGKAD